MGPNDLQSWSSNRNKKIMHATSSKFALWAMGHPEISKGSQPWNDGTKFA